METYMLTIPRQISAVSEWGIPFEWRITLRTIREMIELNDVKKWIVGMEEGKGGYQHYQIRLQTSNDRFFQWVKAHIPWAHMEKAQDSWDYERKEGKYLTWDDNKDILKQRFGNLNTAQKGVISALEATNDRQVVIWYDHEGCKGKTWLGKALWERGLAYVTPSTLNSVQAIVQFVTSSWLEHGRKPYIIIDLPRSWKWTKDLYCAIESIKDGLIYDARYKGRTVNATGVKVLVLTNEIPKLDALSKDRWVFYPSAEFSRGASRNTKRPSVEPGPALPP